MEGLRAPRIGPSINNSAPSVSPGRAAAAIAAAAVVGASTGAALVDAGYNVQTGQRQFTPPVRTASPSTSYSNNPFLSGASGSRAPSLGGNTMPSTPSAMPSVGAGMPPVRGPGGAGAAAIGALLPGLAAAAAAKIQGGDPIAAFKGQLPVSPFSSEAAKANAELSRQAEGNRAGIGNAFQGLGNFLGDVFNRKEQPNRDKEQRKGDKIPRKIKPSDAKPVPGTALGVVYRVDYTIDTQTSQGKVNGSVDLIGAIGGIVEEVFSNADGSKSKKVSIKAQGGSGVVDGKFGLINGGENVSASITNARRLDGGTDPIGPPSGDYFNPGIGLIPPATNADTPVLPGAANRPPNPASTGSPGANAPKTQEAPRNDFKPPSTPQKAEPTKGGETPQNPSSSAPSLPGMTAPLPAIPAAPSTGSASATTPSFPSAFNQMPAQRNADALQPLKPSTPQPPKPQLCADPCIATLQMQQGSGLDALAGMAELLRQLLDGQQQQIADQQQAEEEEEERNELSTIPVPICSCRADGTAEIQQVSIQVPSSQEAATLEQFKALAAIQSAQCQIQRHSERSHNILGGDVWFTDPDGRNPEFKTKLERKVKELGPLFGFPAIPDEDPRAIEIEEEQAALTGRPIEGQIKVKNIISLLNAYASNLYHRAGFQGLPTQVPMTLLGYTDDEPPESIKDLSSYFVWFVKQVDALIGKFPINITIEDVDPLTQGNQTKEIELPNISEALAEMYGVNLAASVNSDVSVNFLMRLASEIIATKNSTLITQDYVRANAAFLGYKGNPARREVNYSFDPAKLNSLDEFLKESKGYLVGWEEDDKESIVGFLQKIVFSSGIIKAAFFRDKKRLLELQKEIESMMVGDKATSEAEWNALLALLNDPTEYFNKDSIPHPRVRDKPAPEPGGATP